MYILPLASNSDLSVTGLEVHLLLVVLAQMCSHHLQKLFIIHLLALQYEVPLLFSFAVFLPLIQCIALIWPSSLSYLTHEHFLVYSGDDDKQVENKKHHDRRKQLEGGSSLIETRDNHMYGSVPLTHWRNFCGLTFMDLSGEWLIDYGEKEKMELKFCKCGLYSCFATKLVTVFLLFFPSIHFLHTFTNAHVFWPYCFL